jgi:hypothetical protein
LSELTYPGAFSGHRVAAIGNVAYVIGAGKVKAIDVSVPTAIKELGTVDLRNGTLMSIRAYQEQLYVGGLHAGVFVLCPWK